MLALSLDHFLHNCIPSPNRSTRSTSNIAFSACQIRSHIFQESQKCLHQAPYPPQITFPLVQPRPSQTKQRNSPTQHSTATSTSTRSPRRTRSNICNLVLLIGRCSSSDRSLGSARRCRGWRATGAGAQSSRAIHRWGRAWWRLFYQDTLAFNSCVLMKDDECGGIAHGEHVSIGDLGREDAAYHFEERIGGYDWKRWIAIGLFEGAEGQELVVRCRVLGLGIVNFFEFCPDDRSSAQTRVNTNAKSG